MLGPRGKKTMTEYEKGYEAAICGKAVDNCPFNSSSGEAIAWCSGWNDAIGAELKAIRLKRMRRR
jgi:ribosome modulation factor